MSRVVQPAGVRGSLKWIQRAVNAKPQVLSRPILERTGDGSIEWLSPLQADEFAEYRDGAFLELLGLDDLGGALESFWPKRGPQWDALGVTDRGGVLLVEAKAHVAELCSPGTQAAGESRAAIERALAETAARLGASPKAAWSACFYQYANRLAHLAFLRARGVNAWLALVSFVGDEEMGGPASAEAWDAAYAVVHHVMDLRKDHPLARHVIHVHPSVAELR